MDEELNPKDDGDTQPLTPFEDDSSLSVAAGGGDEKVTAEMEKTRPVAPVSGSGEGVETASLQPLDELDNTLLGLGKRSEKGFGEAALRVARHCHMGAVRERNEDACLVFSAETGGHFPLMPFGLYIVADGMGGHKNGHVASKIASRTAAQHIVERIYLPLLHTDGIPGATPIQEVLHDAVEQAHQALYDPTDEADTGTTLTIALILGRRLYVAHVGDTRLYIQTADKMEMMTVDHSLVQRLQDVGQLTAEEAAFYQYRHVLLRAVGQGEDLAIDTYTRLLPHKGRLLLCSDGLSGLVPDFEISLILQEDKPVAAIAQELHAAAMEAGGYDNITAIVVEFDL